MKFCEKIKKIRIDNSLTQEEMASKLFVSRSLIAKWEQDRGIPSIDMLNTIATTFGLTVNDLITEEEIKLITLNNHQEVETNKKNLKMSVIIGSVSIIILLILIVVIFETINDKNNDTSNQKEFYVRGEIIEINDDNMIVKNNENQQKIDYDWIKVYHDKYDNNFNRDSLKEGQYVEIKGIHYEISNNYSYKLTLIEEYVDNYLLYGFVITVDDNIPESIPLWGTDWDDNTYKDKPNDDAYPFFLAGLITDGKSYRSSHNYFDYTIDYCENAPYLGSYDIKLQISISLDKKINVFAIDNSEKGFTFIQSIEPIELSRITKINLEGYVINEGIKNADDNEYLGYSSKVNYQLMILHEYFPEGYTIYEYDANNILINETSFSTYEEFKESFKKAKEETVYCIVKRFGDGTSTKKVYLGEKYTFEILDEFGYIYTLDYYLR